ncbi:hypothetical protein HDU98_011136 [Podochytrium sp. JEL0797]|nr:hypothetical protein HDU98_011136 [Podochytrium sp. JEL0797]
MQAITIRHGTAKPPRHDPIVVSSVPKPLSLPGHVLVQIHSTAINHRDLFIREGLYPGITQHPSILGSDASGTTCSASKKFSLGSRVLVNPARGWIADPSCPEGELKVLGLGDEQGTFAEFISVHEDDLVKVPDHLSMEEGAAVPLAGLTAYRAVIALGECKPGQKVLIPGIGGGVALFALQFALSIGAQVFVTSSSDAKLQQAIKLGAAGGVNYKSAKWVQELQTLSPTPFNLIIDGAAGPNLPSYLRLLAPGGTVCIFGAGAGPSGTLTFPHLWFKHATLKGACMGSRREFVEMVDFVREKQVRPVVDCVFGDGLRDVEKAFERMKSGAQFGKVVVSGIAKNARL